MRARTKAPYPIDIRAWVAASRAAQGLPPVVTDAAVLARLAALLATHHDRFAAGPR